MERGVVGDEYRVPAAPRRWLDARRAAPRRTVHGVHAHGRGRGAQHVTQRLLLLAEPVGHDPYCAHAQRRGAAVHDATAPREAAPAAREREAAVPVGRLRHRHRHAHAWHVERRWRQQRRQRRRWARPTHRANVGDADAAQLRNGREHGAAARVAEPELPVVVAAAGVDAAFDGVSTR